jgi:hypothetical protein
MKRKINVDKVLNDIKMERKARKIVIANYKDWDVLDGRTQQGKPIKKIAKVVDFIACTLGYVAFAAIIVVFIFAWI